MKNLKLSKLEIAGALIGVLFIAPMIIIIILDLIKNRSNLL